MICRCHISTTLKCATMTPQQISPEFLWDKLGLWDVNRDNSTERRRESQKSFVGGTIGATRCQEDVPGILEGRADNYLMQKFNLEKISIQVHDAVTSMLGFICGLTKEEREETKLVSLLNVPPWVLSYYKNGITSSPNMQVTATTFKWVAPISL